jgi:hypothetical protein
MRVDLTFGPSRSPRYDYAVSLAKSLKSYHYNSEDDLHEIHEPLTWGGWRTLWALAEMTYQWAASALSSEWGNPLLAFAEMEKVEACHLAYASRPDVVRHCAGQMSPTSDPGWFGCRFLVGVRLLHPPVSILDSGSPAWWEFGALDPDCKSLMVDKGAINKLLDAENRDNPCSLCPAMDWNLTRKLVGELPSLLVVGEDWVIRHSMIDPDRAIGVAPNPRGAFGVMLQQE